MGQRDERVDSRDRGEIFVAAVLGEQFLCKRGGIVELTTFRRQYTLFANASTNGTPPVRALFWEFPDEAELFAVDRQFLVGRDILVTPVLTSNVSTVDGWSPSYSSHLKELRLTNIS
jgi:hypothetical protein